jgi:CheY-like chemotaxis protein
MYAANGKEAVDVCKEKEFDLIFMDIKMPIMNGLQATEQIKKIKLQIPIVIQSANLDKTNTENALAIGCADFPEKPKRIPEPEKIIKKIRS